MLTLMARLSGEGADRQDPDSLDAAGPLDRGGQWHEIVDMGRAERRQEARSERRLREGAPGVTPTPVAPLGRAASTPGTRRRTLTLAFTALMGLIIVAVVGAIAFLVGVLV